MNRILKNKKKVPFLFNALFVFILVHSYIPIIGFYTPAVVYAGVISLMYVVAFVVMMGGNRLLKLLMTVFPLYLVNVLEIIHHSFSGQGFAFTELYGLAQNLLPAICTLFLLEKRDKSSAKILLSVLFVCCLITSVTTYFGCRVFPNASRILATTIRGDDIALYATYMKFNIGGYSFIYTIALLIPVVVYLAKIRKINIIMAIMIVVVFFFAIIQSEYTTALLFSVIGLLFCLLPAKMEWRKMRRFILLIVIGGIALFEIVPPVLRFVASSSESEQVSSRLNDLADVASGDDIGLSVDSDFTLRQERYQKSWNSFVNSNFLGRWSQSNAGGHSYFLDRLAVYGVLGLILLIVMYVSLFRLYFKPYRAKPWYGTIVLLLFLAILLAAINTGNSFPFMCLVLPLFNLVVDEPYA